MKELDVPHWARHAVSDLRDKLEVPAAITDRMIWAHMAANTSIEQPVWKFVLNFLLEVKEHLDETRYP